MIETRLIFVEGLPATGKSLLAQRVKRQLALQHIECHWYHGRHQAHPLHRSYDPQAFASIDEYALSLAVQWQNFASRTEAESGVWLFDSALMQPAPSSLLEAGLRESRVDKMIADLLEAVGPLAPVILYQWHEDAQVGEANWTRFRDWADALFAHRNERRLLLNRTHVEDDEALTDVLGFLGVRRHEPSLPAGFVTVLSGAYRSAAGAGVRITAHEGAPDDAPLAVDGLTAAGDPVPLLPLSTRELWLAGSTLRIHPQWDHAGGLLGFMLASADPHEPITQSFFSRLDERA